MVNSDDLFHEALNVIPGGVNSPVRAYGSVGGTPRFVERARGPWVWDTDGNRYADLVCSWGPAILGHAEPHVVAQVQRAADNGLSFGAPTQAEVTLAELVVERIKPVEMLRLVSTGTEATMTAIRLARGYTQRDLIVKFAGCYHGHSDALLVAAGSGMATAGMPASAGVTQATAEQTIVLPYNDIQSVRAAFDQHGSSIAAVITEASPANMGVVPPGDGFNQQLAECVHSHGALLIYDEVLTGFRCGYDGFWGADQRRGNTYIPDLITFGKVIGGGMPLAAVGGRSEVMSCLAPIGSVYQAGTLSGNPLATAAGIETLRRTTPDIYGQLQSSCDYLMDALHSQLNRVGVPYCIQHAESLFSVFFGDGPARAGVRHYQGAQTQDSQMYARFFHGMLSQGVHLPPSGYEAWFLSTTHTSEVLELIAKAFGPAAEEAARGDDSEPASSQ